MTGMEYLFGIVGIACGVYAFYSCYQLRITKDITKSLLFPKEANPKKCKDKEAYISETIPKLMIVGVLAIVYGIAELVNYYAVKIPVILLGSMILLGVVLIWAGFTAKKMNKKYFPGM